ncbi:MAG TPA: hypothetical protein VH234_05655, partial [Candidatus Saccharimonadales bacterium]|nr:hypothetical protein [Candidatus Saccharimonadales bacterium]
MSARVPNTKGIITIEHRILDLRMTLIIGIKTKDGLIIGSDGFAKVTLGYTEIPSEPEIDQPKVFQVSPTIVIGITGGMLNRVEQVVSDISRSIREHGVTSLASLALGIESYIPKMFADRVDHPNFGISFFIAGYVDDKKGADEGKQMVLQHEGKIYHYDDNEP